MSRRTLLGGSALGMAALTGCGGIAGGSGGGEGSLRFAFWGSSARERNYRTVFEDMQEALPDISVRTEFAGLDDFIERMTTQMAGNNIPDIFWVPATQVMTYDARDLYRPLEGVSSLDLSDYTPEEIEDFELNGVHNTLPFGSFVPVVRYNKTFAEEDGVEISPDWDWDQWAEFAIDYSRENSAQRKAVMYDAGHDISFEGWLRQHGEELWTQDGQVGFTAETVEGWIAWWEHLRAEGATPSISEQDGVGGSWEDTGDSLLMRFGNSNHIVDEGNMFPDYDFGLLHQPLNPSAEGHQFIYYPRMAISSDASDENAELAGEVLTYLTTNVEVQRTLGLTMGVPANTRVAAEYEEFASPVEAEMLRVLGEDRDADRRPRYDAPVGTNGWLDIFRRSIEQVTTGGVGISEAAATIVEDIDAQIQSST